MFGEISVLKDIDKEKWADFLSNHFANTVLARREGIPRWIQRLSTVPFLVFGAVFLVVTLIEINSSTGIGVASLFLGIVFWAIADCFYQSPLHLALVPNTLVVDDKSWVPVKDLIAVSGQPDFFRTPHGSLLLVERTAVLCQVSRVNYLPEEILNKRRVANREAEARSLIVQDKLSAARQLVDGTVDKWRVF